MKQKSTDQYKNLFFAKLLSSPAGVIAANWLMQGMRYMNIYELTVKLTLDFFLVLMVFVLTDWDFYPTHLFFAFLLAHTVNWLLNGHFFTLMRYVWPVKKTRQQFEDYISALRDDVMHRNFVNSVGIYGSYSRNAWHCYSDLDVRLIVSPNLGAGVKGALYCVWLRSQAFFQAFPLDVYSCVGPVCLNRLRKDEVPVVLKDVDGFLFARHQKDSDKSGIQLHEKV